VAQTLPERIKRAEIEAGWHPGVILAEAPRNKDLKREVEELRRANEIHRTASACFAHAELDSKLISECLH